MFEKLLEQVVTGIFAMGIVGLFVWDFKKRMKSIDDKVSSVQKCIDDEISKMKAELHSFKLHIAQTYITKEEHEKRMESFKEYMKEGFTSVKEAIIELQRKFDRFEERVQKQLDRKMDKE